MLHEIVVPEMNDTERSITIVLPNGEIIVIKM